MGYFTGPLLEQKVAEYELEDLDQKLAGIADGSDTSWPDGGYGIPAVPAYLESARIVLYSMLHHYKIKKQFVVKADYYNFVIYIDKKKLPIDRGSVYASSSIRKRAGALFIPSATDTGHRSSLQDIPAVPEDLDGLMAEDITLDTPVGQTGLAAPNNKEM